MKKAVIFSVLAFAFCGLCFSQAGNPLTITVEITNIVINGGNIYLTVFSNSESFVKEDPEIAYRFLADHTSLTKEIWLPRGEYVLTVIQDANNNRILDYGPLEIPKELVGMSNYFGHGLPSRNFEKQKILINEKTGKIVIGLYKF